MRKTPLKLLAPILMIFLLNGCLGIPQGIAPIDNFKVNKYLGKWYEIARLDHSFEKGLSAVTAEYSLREDGGIKVINSGKQPQQEERKVAEGKAYFISSEKTGHLKVSFFGPFYGSYIIFEIDEDDYQYAFITSYDRSYLWFLARTPDVSKELTAHFIKRANQLGFNTNELIFVKHH
jgi:apolipoprotein D and lipocalin family protein|tara:strand:+ start:73553 stop:74083 length:531 start_codon:yes stop_codon:yes gene_type:complete